MPLPGITRNPYCHQRNLPGSYLLFAFCGSTVILYLFIPDPIFPPPVVERCNQGDGERERKELFPEVLPGIPVYHQYRIYLLYGRND